MTATPRPGLVVATAGHVDHGKSALLRALTGTDPDRLAEERRRGLTLDLGFVWTTAPDGRPLAFVDVPGHHRYLATTFAGVATAPAVLLVVSADEGWRPQTEQHLAAIDAFGIRSGLLVITRSDLADPGAARAQAGERLARSGLAGAPAVAVSARTGAGLDQLRAELAALATDLPMPDAAAPVRLWLDRAFTVDGAGTVVTGTLTAGTLAVDDTLRLAPSDAPVRIRGLQSLGREVSRVTGPARVAVNLRRVQADQLRRGQALLTPERWWSATTVDIRHAPGSSGRAGASTTSPRLPAEPLVHCGTAVTSARLRPLREDSARLTLRTPLPLHVGDRILLRDPGSRLLLGATVLDLDPPLLTGRGAAAHRARRLAAVTDPHDPAVRVAATGLARRHQLVSMGYALPTSGDQWLVDPAHAERLAAALAGAVREHAAAHPDDPGLPLAAARRRLQLPDGVPLSTFTGPDLVERGERLYRAVDAERLPPAVATALDRLLAELAEAPFAAPTRQRLNELGLSGDALALLVRRGRLERVGTLYLAPGATPRAAARLRRLPQPFTVGEAARALGTSRRVAVPLLEALDAALLTRRHPDGRRATRDPVPHAG
ncbi:selenocysteine-specific elongation factor [Streptomyces zhaozhouensis]|uniref:Selenocysteine-specific elongation factor n=1 Tax=Streptomyces zhaozhouensis TaxID=1300267 RepID=A0A286E0G5_9ACTN|nr:selenocysteine-specific translation elongation factor [Streptomyces zhaozhouensis]SOD64360.1 selenocysteine-specific elongation factor [Streptomyces zhaozhouensis]